MTTTLVLTANYLGPPDSPATDGFDRTQDLDGPRLRDQVSCALGRIGEWSDFGVRVLIDETELYASVELRVPAGLPRAWAARLAEFATQRIPYTDRDRAWDAVSNGKVTSNPDLWNCFVDSTLEAERFATNAVEHAVWAHAREEGWDWPHPVPGRVEDKYKRWGDDHPLAHLRRLPEVIRAPISDDVEF